MTADVEHSRLDRVRRAGGGGGSGGPVPGRPCRRHIVREMVAAGRADGPAAAADAAACARFEDGNATGGGEA